MEEKVMQDVVEEKVEAEETAPVKEVLEENTENEAAPQNDNDKPSVGARVKEWFRKQIVGLKKAPQRIPLFFLLIASICYMLILFNYSKTINQSSSNLKYAGICVFVATLLSLLVLVSFLNAFPKRKKINWFFIALVIVMVGAMIACDILVYKWVSDNLTRLGADANTSNYDPARRSLTHSILHLVFLGIFAVIFALLPLIKMGLNKINTKKVVESASSNMKEEIDLQE